MYKILGTDQKVYGPVSLDQVKQWIKENRADGATQALPEGATEWKALSALPEFADALGSKAAAGATPSSVSDPPPRPATDPFAMADRVLARGAVINPFHCLSRGWELVMSHFWLLVGATFVINLVSGAAPIIAGAFYGGLYLLFLKLIRGRQGEFADAFAGFSGHFLHLFLAGLVVSALSAVGFLACILPGIYLSIAWLAAVPLVIDKRLDFWPAMEISRRVIHKHWFSFLGLVVLSVLVYLAGVLCCCVGVFVSAPVIIGAFAYAYEDLFGPEPEAASRSF